MIIILGSTMTLMVIIVSTKAFSRYEDTRDNIIGESTVLFTTYMFYIFDIVKTQYLINVGYVPIGAIGLYVLVNLTIAMVVSVKGTKSAIKRKSVMRNYTKSRAKA